MTQHEVNGGRPESALSLGAAAAAAAAGNDPLNGLVVVGEVGSREGNYEI